MRLFFGENEILQIFVLKQKIEKYGMLLPGKQLCGLCSTEKRIWIFWLHKWYLW